MGAESTTLHCYKVGTSASEQVDGHSSDTLRALLKQTSLRPIPHQLSIQQQHHQRGRSYLLTW